VGNLACCITAEGTQAQYKGYAHQSIVLVLTPLAIF